MPRRRGGDHLRVELVLLKGCLGLRQEDSAAGRDTAGPLLRIILLAILAQQFLYGLLWV
jgi:hypothetical protein